MKSCAGGNETVGMNGGSGHHRRAQTQGGGPSRGQSLSRRESLMDRLKRVASQPALAIPQVSISGDLLGIVCMIEGSFNVAYQVLLISLNLQMNGQQSLHDLWRYSVIPLVIFTGFS